MNAQRHDFLGNTARCEALVLNEDSEPEACGWGEQASIHEPETAPRIPVRARCEAMDPERGVGCRLDAGHDGSHESVMGRPFGRDERAIERQLHELVEAAFAAGVQSVVEVAHKRELARRRYQRIYGEEIAKLAAELAR
jgi:hypothetical protein